MTENINLRSFQKYLTTGMKTLTDEEQRSLNLSGAAVVVPQSIYASLITDEKYSDLLYRATSFNDPRPGKIQVPIASNNNGVFHTELAPIGEASPTLTSLELGGYEIARLMQISAAAASMSAPEFESMMLNLLASEVVNGIEESVIKGTGIGEPKGLDNITWVLGTNDVAAALTVKVADIASGLSLLPSKYSKGSIILLNSKTLYALAQSESTGGSYAFNLADASEKFMGKELVVNENIADNTVYIVAPAQLYVRWSLPLQMELDKSAGFTSFSQYIRAAAVMDAKWNEKACVRVKVQP
jgi:HK97 family phage major capsid protein